MPASLSGLAGSVLGSSHFEMSLLTTISPALFIEVHG